MNHSHCGSYNMFETQVVILSLKIKSDSKIHVEQKRSQGRNSVVLGVC